LEVSVGIAFELSVLLVVAILGQSTFAVFEVETPPWRKILKWGIVVGVTLGLSWVVGHWAVLVPLLGGVAGAVGHTVWCRRHGIDPLRATPRRKYYELRGWTWQE
jgi:hypothetical protein